MTSTSLSYYHALFRELPPPDLAGLSASRYRAEFAGPWWLRRAAPPGLALLHFAGWWGKAFDSNASGHNLFLRRGELQPGFAFSLAEKPSLVDSRPSLVVAYAPDSPFPWRITIDELRRLDSKRLLGMTITKAGILKKIALPFVLHLER